MKQELKKGLDTMAALHAAIEKYNSGALVFPLKGDLLCTNHPNKLEQPIKDFIECHYSVIDRDMYGITFKKKV